MALFKLKKQDRGSWQKVEDGQFKVARRPTESLGSVLSESVPGAALNIIMSNPVFELPADGDGNKRYVVATLDVNTIGGLNKRAARSNPDKGQLIECINCGNIEAYVSAQGIAEDRFVIIPTDRTMESLSEFRFLSDKEQFGQFIPTVCVIDQNGSMIFQELPESVPYEWFNNISRGAVRASDAVGVAGPEGQPVTDDVPPGDILFGDEDSDGPDVQDSGSEAVQKKYEEISFDETDEGAQESGGEDFWKNMNIDLNDSDDGNDFQCPVCNNYVDSTDETCPFCGTSFIEDVPKEFEDAAGQEKALPVREITDMDITRAVERLFHAGDLDLEISAEPFDVRIIGENGYVPMIEEREDGWLDSYATQMIKNANEELRKLHHDNLLKCRQRYLSLMTNNAEDIADRVDYHNASTSFYKMYKLFETQKEEKKDALEDQIAQKRAEMERTWNEELERIKASAAMAAERSYIDNHAKAHETASREVEIMLLDEVEREHRDNLMNLNQLRKNEARKMLDIAVTETLEVVGRAYTEMVEGENARRTEILSQISAYVDAHLKDAAARDAVLAEAQRQKEEADRVAEEFQRKMESISNDHKSACDKLHGELDAARLHEENLIREYDLRLGAESDRYNELEGRYKELMDKYVSIDREKSKEYETRIITLENDKRAAEEHLAHVDIVHNRFNRVSVAVWISVAVAMFAIGILSGNIIGADRSLGNRQYSISLTGASGDAADGMADEPEKSYGE